MKLKLFKVCTGKAKFGKKHYVMSNRSQIIFRKSWKVHVVTLNVQSLFGQMSPSLERVKRYYSDFMAQQGFILIFLTFLLLR